jgi:Tol biopolymer transport system component
VSEIKRHKKGLVLALALIVIVIAGASFALYKLANRSRSGRPVSFATAKITRLTTSGKVTDAAISPDGKYVAHVVDDAGRQSLWVRQVATQSNVEIVQASEDQFIGLAFSPDGNYIYYSVREKGSGSLLGLLYQVPSLGGAARKVLTGIVSPVSFSPDGKRFAYHSRSTNEPEDLLMIANADGSGARKLAGRRGNERFSRGSNSSLSWSPDGKTIVSKATNIDEDMTVVAVSVESGEIKFFTPQKWRSVDGVAWLADGGGLLVTAREPAASQQSQIWQVSYPEGAAHRVTNDLNGYRSLSLDANSDALVTVRGERVANIWVMPANDTAHATQITAGRRDDSNPSWTPDGAVVYDSNASGNRELYLIDAHGGNARQITANSSYNNVFPSVSPDGRYIAFVAGMGASPHIWRIGIDGFNPQQLTNSRFDLLPQWSPDSQWIVYYSSDSGVEIWKVGANGGQPVRLHEKFAFAPTVSPDGKQVACNYRDNPNAPFKLAVLPIEGGQPTKTFDKTLDGQSYDAFRRLRWTADGRAIVYELTRGGVSNLWAQPLDGGQPKQFTNFTSDLIFSFDLSRDGKQLALSRGTVTSDVVLISNFK